MLLPNLLPAKALDTGSLTLAHEGHACLIRAHLLSMSARPAHACLNCGKKLKSSMSENLLCFSIVRAN